jgi:AcrR family transcriptional regulator
LNDVVPDDARRTCRPRIEGDRESEILDATVDLLLELGYDRLTLDRVASQARASKATLYRRWSSKQSLVIDAVMRARRPRTEVAPDTGSLRSDLLALYGGAEAWAECSENRVVGVVLTALQVDAELATEFREKFLQPKVALIGEVYRRAEARGELLPGADPALLGPALPGILLHRAFVLGDPVTNELVERVLDGVIVPAATGRRPDVSESP